MGVVSFVYSNPRHHVEMMAPVMAELCARGVSCRAVSLAELRGFVTQDMPLADVECRRVIPLRARRDPSLGASIGTGRGRGRLIRRTVQRTLWTTALAPRLLCLTRKSDVIVVPNDAAFPYGELAKLARRTGKPFVLMQEGIRFSLPGVQHENAYGSGGAAAICAWGEASAEYFRGQGASASTVHVTGNPRFDRLDRLQAADFAEKGRALLAHRGIARSPLVYLSNPIDDQGFCTTREKLDLFGRFADLAAPVLEAKDLHLVVKLHTREDAAAFREVGSRTRAGDRVQVLDNEPLFPVLASARATVVLASTVGLEALALGVPLGVLEIPGAGFLFDYVQSRAAIGLRLDESFGASLDEILARGPGGVHAGYLERHLAHRGHAAKRAAELIASVKGAACEGVEPKRAAHPARVSAIRRLRVLRSASVHLE